MNPIHLGHIQMMELAKKTVEDQGWTVLQGVISPSHDKFVIPKAMDMNTTFAGANDRCDMVEALIEGNEACDWLSVGHWESSSKH